MLWLRPDIPGSKLRSVSSEFIPKIKGNKSAVAEANGIHYREPKVSMAEPAEQWEKKLKSVHDKGQQSRRWPTQEMQKKQKKQTQTDRNTQRWKERKAEALTPAGSSLNTGWWWGKERQVWWVEQGTPSAQTSPVVTEESSKGLKEKNGTTKTTLSAPPTGRLAKLQHLITQILVRVQGSPGVVGRTLNLTSIDSRNVFHPWPGNSNSFCCVTEHRHLEHSLTSVCLPAC